MEYRTLRSDKMRYREGKSLIFETGNYGIQDIWAKNYQDGGYLTPLNYGVPLF